MSTNMSENGMSIHEIINMRHRASYDQWLTQNPKKAPRGSRMGWDSDTKRSEREGKHDLRSGRMTAKAIAVMPRGAQETYFDNAWNYARAAGIDITDEGYYDQFAQRNGFARMESSEMPFDPQAAAEGSVAIADFSQPTHQA